MKEYKKLTTEKETQSLENRIRNLDARNKKLFNSFVDASSSVTRKMIETEIESNEFLKEELTKTLLKLKSLKKHNITKNDLIIQIKKYCNQDPLNFEFQKKVIDSLVNTVFVSDDRITIYYNIGDIKKMTFTDNQKMLEDIKEKGIKAPSLLRDKKVRTEHSMAEHLQHHTNSLLSNSVYYIFVSGMLGLVCSRK